MQDHVISGYDVEMDNSYGNWLSLKTAHISKDSREAVCHESRFDLDEPHPITQNDGPDIMICGETFDPNCKAYQDALNSEHVASLNGYSTADKEVYALSMYIHEQGIESKPQMVSAMENRQKQLEGASMSSKEDLCSAPNGFEKNTAAVILTKNDVFLLTNDGHMFDATEMATENSKGPTETHRQNAISDYVTGLEGKQEVFYGSGDVKNIGSHENMHKKTLEYRDVSGAAMEHQTTAKTVGTEFKNLRSVEDPNKDLTHDLDISVKFGDDARG